MIDTIEIVRVEEAEGFEKVFAFLRSRLLTGMPDRATLDRRARAG